MLRAGNRPCSPTFKIRTTLSYLSRHSPKYLVLVIFKHGRTDAWMAVVNLWMRPYNAHRRHSSMTQVSPIRFGLASSMAAWTA